jgi:hypothetical protein
MKGMLTVKGSGCVRVTASGAFAQVGSLKRPGSRANAAFDPLQCHELRGEDVQTDHVFNEHGICGEAKFGQGLWG